MNLRHTVFAIISLSAIALPCAAQTMRPGLWQINNKISSQNSQLAQQMAAAQKMMANMPPEQRKAMEDMMKKNGVSMPTMTDDGMIVKACLTKEMVAQNQVPVQTTGNCTHQRSPIVGGQMTMSYQCSNPDSSGQGTISFTRDTAYTMTMNMTHSMQGKKETMSMAAKGQWLGADCGDVKPLAMPPAKAR
jgi:hypothetical protein